MKPSINVASNQITIETENIIVIIKEDSNVKSNPHSKNNCVQEEKEAVAKTETKSTVTRAISKAKEKKCRYCGRIYEPKSNAQQYCSTKCSERYKSEKSGNFVQIGNAVTGHEKE